MNNVNTSINSISFFNANYFNSIKNLRNTETAENELVYPSLEKFEIRDNFIIYMNSYINLGIVDLRYLDPSLFTFNSNEIYFILGNMANLINSPNSILEEIANAEKIISSSSFNEKEKIIIHNYVSKYYQMRSLESYDYYGLKEELSRRQNVISKAYLPEYEKSPASEYIQSICTQYANHMLSTGNNKSNTKIKVLTNNQSNISNNNYMDYDDTKDFFRTAGFAYTTTTIIGTIILGIIIAILTLYYM